MLIRIFSILLTFTVLASPSALAKLEVISVLVDGVGSTKAEAVSDGLVQAISQVNGAEVAAHTMSSLREQSSVGPGGQNYALDEAYQKDITSKTSGVVQGWTVQSEKQEPAVSNLWVVTLTVRVSKYDTSQQLSRLRMAVGEFRISDAGDQRELEVFEKAFSRKLQDYLTQTRKFAMLDREFLDDQSGELGLIASGAFQTAELARIGNRVGTDYLIVGEVESARSETEKRVMKTTGQEITTRNAMGRVSYRIIDVATTQVKFSDSVTGMVASNSLGDAARQAASSAGEKILNAIFPIRVVSLTGSSAVLAQGGGTLKNGDLYKLVQLGSRIVDPYTKESLGREEMVIGRIQITDVQSRSSSAKVVRLDVEFTPDQPLPLLIARPESKVSNEQEAAKAVEEVAAEGKAKVDKLLQDSDEDW
jgi:hypothetical protein